MKVSRTAKLAASIRALQDEVAAHAAQLKVMAEVMQENSQSSTQRERPIRGFEHLTHSQLDDVFEWACRNNVIAADVAYVIRTRPCDPVAELKLAIVQLVKQNAMLMATQTDDSSAIPSPPCSAGPS